MTAPAFRVLSGNPTDTEVAALRAVFDRLLAEARTRGAGDGDGERNLWGRLGERYDRHGRQGLFNPCAFRNVRYF